MFEFIPDKKDPDKVTVPYIEDVRADEAQFYTSKKSIEQAQSELSHSMTKLGASLTKIIGGTYKVDGLNRIGYQIEFSLDGKLGTFPILGLPMRKPTEPKADQVRVQALLNVKLWIDAMVSQRVFSPGRHPLTPYLLLTTGETVIEAAWKHGLMPQAPALPESNITISKSE